MLKVNKYPNVGLYGIRRFKQNPIKALRYRIFGPPKSGFGPAKPSKMFYVEKFFKNIGDSLKSMFSRK